MKFIHINNNHTKHRYSSLAESLEDDNHNLRVCGHCLAAINSHEGRQPFITIYADDFDVEDLDGENGLTCEWCDEPGFDGLFELI